MRARKNFSLDIKIYPGQFLLTGTALDHVQSLIRENAPEWSENLHVWRYRAEKTPVNVYKEDGLREAIRSRASERGPLYHQLESRYGAGSPRFFGSAELRGTDDSITLIVAVDEDVLRQAGDKVVWGNWITFQVREPKVDGVDAVVWGSKMFEELCAAVSPFYGHAHMSDEYEAKNISHEGGGTEAIGVDISRHLPGLYWANFFGRPYVELIGRDRLLRSPAEYVREVDAGVLIRLGPDPRGWQIQEYRATEQLVRQHIGLEYFFSRDEPNRKTTSPDFGFIPRSRRPSPS